MNTMVDGGGNMRRVEDKKNTFGCAVVVGISMEALATFVGLFSFYYDCPQRSRITL